MPTEAEWEKAARGGVHLDGPDGKRRNPFPDRIYPWGDAPPRAPDGSYRANIDAVIDLDDNRDEDGTVPDNQKWVPTAFNYSRATTIYGGSNEIQRNVIAKWILQLPSK